MENKKNDKGDDVYGDKVGGDKNVNSGINYGNIGGQHHAVRPQNAENESFWKKYATELVERGQLEEALGVALQHHPTREVQLQAAQIRARIAQFRKELAVGTISKSEELEELDKIRQGILLLIFNC